MMSDESFRESFEKKRRAFELKVYSTSELVSELMEREGVTTITAEPYKRVMVPANGPAIILVVTD